MLKKLFFSLCFCLPMLYAGDNLLANFDFSQFEGNGRAAGWSSPSHFNVDINGGANGNCMAFENTKPESYQLCSQSISCRADDRFLFGAYVKTEDMTGEDSGATICLEWFDDTGKFRGGHYPHGIKGTNKEWMLIQETTVNVPEGVTRARFSLYARKGMIGKAWFDRPFLRLLKPELLGHLSISAYRNIAEGDSLEATVALNLRPLNVDPDNLIPSFEVVGPDGNGGPFVTAAAKELTLKSCTGIIDISGLPAGDYRLKASFQFKDSKVKHSVSVPFTRSVKPLERRCFIDGHRRLVVDGKPFFPLGLYTSNANEEDLKVIANSPFNCIMPYGPPKDIEGMDKVSENGLKIIYSIKDAFPGTKYCPADVKTDEDAEAFVARKVSTFANHPALLAWYINDERPLSMLDKLIARQNLLERLDPNHPTWVVLYQYTQIADYLGSFDVIGTDPYPIPGKGAYEAARWTQSTVAGSFSHHAVWQVPQIFNWANYRKGPGSGKERKPTLAEIKCMFWLCIANGANGLIPYSYYDLKKPTNGVPFEEAWAEVCEAAAMVKEQIPVLLSVEQPITATTEAEMVDTRVWRHEGADYVLVVNGNTKPVDVEVRLGGQASSATAVFGPAPLLKGNAFAISLKAFEPAFVKLTP